MSNLTLILASNISWLSEHYKYQCIHLLVYYICWWHCLVLEKKETFERLTERQQSLVKRDAINSVTEGKRVMTGPKSHWWGWWMAFSSNTWQFITHLRHAYILIVYFHTESHTCFSPLLTFCSSTYAVLQKPFSFVLMALQSRKQPWKSSHVHAQTHRNALISYPDHCHNIPSSSLCCLTVSICCLLFSVNSSAC